MAAEILLVRHGETEWNIAGRYQGGKDSPLTARGREQAAAVGDALAGLCAGQDWPILSSPLGRAHHSAQIMAERMAAPAPLTDAALREISLGSWDGLTDEEMEAAHPGMRAGSTRYDWYFRSPDGETLAQAKARVAQWIASIDRPVIAVTHGLVSRVVRGVYLGLPDAEATELPVTQGVIWQLKDGELRTIVTEAESNSTWLA